MWWHVHGSAAISGEKKGKSKYLGSLGHIHSNLEVSQETFSEKNKKKCCIVILKKICHPGDTSYQKQT